MTLLEQKVDAIAHSLLANDVADRHAALTELKALMQKPYNPADGMESVARQLLIELGVPENRLGSKYLIKAICEVVEDERKIQLVTSRLYPSVADIYDTTWSRVERAIRCIIEEAWLRVDSEVALQYFGNTVAGWRGKPTNTEFIARCANIVRERMGGA